MSCVGIEFNYYLKNNTLFGCFLNFLLKTQYDFPKKLLGILE